MPLRGSGGKRLKMGFSMFAAARALVAASVLATEPLASPPALGRALSLRFYGADFSAEERERIAARLRQGEARPRVADGGG